MSNSSNTSQTSVTCVASVGKHGKVGTVFLKVCARGRLRFLNLPFPAALELASAMGMLLCDADIRARGFITVGGFQGGASLDIELEQVEPIADELVRASCRASGVKA